MIYQAYIQSKSGIGETEYVIHSGPAVGTTYDRVARAWVEIKGTQTTITIEACDQQPDDEAFRAHILRQLAVTNPVSFDAMMKGN
jgi:hypothetical protein